MIDANQLAIEITENSIESMIFEIRGQKVMLDSDLAAIYGYSTKRFNEQVKRNIEKFPEDFMFQLTTDEAERIVKFQSTTSQNNAIKSEKSLWSQKSTLNKSGNLRGQHIKYLPYVFTEQGVYMLMTVLRGGLAVKQSKALIRLFKKMKDIVVSNKVLLNADELIRISKGVEKNTRDIKTIKHDLNEVMSNFIDPKTYKHFLILAGQKIEADVAYQTIYGLANESIIIVDDYVSTKTLLLLKAAKPNTQITIISDNKAFNKLEDSFIDDYKKNVNQSLTIKESKSLFHDRYIIIDRGTTNERVYHCGSSSKDAGNKITTIDRLDDSLLYSNLINALLL